MVPLRLQILEGVRDRPVSDVPVLLFDDVDEEVQRGRPPHGRRPLGAFSSNDSGYKPALVSPPRDRIIVQPIGSAHLEIKISRDGISELAPLPLLLPKAALADLSSLTSIGAGLGLKPQLLWRPAPTSVRCLDDAMKLHSEPLDCFSCALHHHLERPTSIHYVAASRG